jgi:hypothetical protein
VGIIKALLRIFSYIFEGVLALFVLGISLMSLRSGAALNLEFLPWTGMKLSYWLLGLALAGLITLLLALAGRLRVLFFLWSLAVLVLLFRGLFLSFYPFTGPVTFKAALELTAGMILGTIGAIPWARRARW